MLLKRSNKLLLIILTLFIHINDVNATEPSKTGSNHILKWVDEKGETHYGDSIPPQYAGKSSMVLDSNGRVIKKNQEFSPANDSVTSNQEIAKERHDHALLESYTSEEEIDLARDRSTELDQLSIQSFKQRRETLQERLDERSKLASGFTQNKKPIPVILSQDIANEQVEIASLNQQIKDKLDNIEATKKRFDQDKQRFVELKTKGMTIPAQTKPNQ